jgi:hypothetical protein
MWYPTSREKRARYGAPSDLLRVLVFKSFGGGSPRRFRPTYPGFLPGAPPTPACAAFIKESRMKCANARKLDRKSGVRWGERGAPVFSFASILFRGKDGCLSNQSTRLFLKRQDKVCGWKAQKNICQQAFAEVLRLRAINRLLCVNLRGASLRMTALWGLRQTCGSVCRSTKE